MTKDNEALLERILAAGRADAGIRALALIGSSVGGEGRNDEYSDIDLILVTGEPRRYLDSASWAAPIGEVWFSFSEAVPEANHQERRFLLEGGLDLDVVVIDAGILATTPESLVIAREICSGGVRVILDKEELSPRIMGLAGARPEFRFPDEAAFLNLVNDFYFHCLWAEKKNLRGERWVALQSVDGYLKQKTLAMLEWRERALRGREYDTRYCGRFLERWVDPAFLPGIAESFGGYDKDGVSRAIDAGLGLFTAIGRETARALGFRFPDAEVARLVDHLRALRGR